MLVKYKIAGAGTWETLFDDSQGGGTLNVSFSDILNLSPGFGAGSVGVLPEGNCSCSVTISQMTVIYATETAASAAKRAMRTALRGQKLHLRVVVGEDSEFYPNGSLKSMSVLQRGQSVDYNLTFQTEDVTDTAPTT